MFKKAQRRRNSAINSFFGFGNTLLAVITGVLLVPFYLTHISVSSYGVWMATGNLVAWFGVLDPGLGDLARQRAAHFHGKQDWASMGQTACCGLLAVLFVGCIVIIAGQVLADVLVGFVNLEDKNLANEGVALVKLSSIGAALMLIGGYLSGLLQGLQTSFWVGLGGFIATLSVPISRTYLLVEGFGARGFAWALVVQGGVLSILSFLVLMYYFRGNALLLRPSLREARELASLLSYTSLTKIGGIISNNIRSVLVTRILGPQTTAVFEITRRPIEMLRAFLDKPVIAFLPAFSHLAATGDKEKESTYILMYFRITTFLVFGLMLGIALLNRSFVSLWVGSELYAGNTVNFLLALGLVVSTYSNGSRILLYAFGHIRYTSILVVLNNAILVVVAYFGLIYFGLPGIASASIVLFVVFSVWFIPRRLFVECVGVLKTKAFIVDTVLPTMLVASLCLLIGINLGVENLSGKGWIHLMIAAMLLSMLYTILVALVSKPLRDYLYFAIKRVKGSVLR